jgi:hypothetical protein
MGNPFILDLGFQGISTMAAMKVMTKNYDEDHDGAKRY